MGVKNYNQFIALTHFEKQELYKICDSLCVPSLKGTTIWSLSKKFVQISFQIKYIRTP